MTIRDRTIVIAIANGKTYREIGRHFGLSAGQVDNIVQRLRRDAKARTFTNISKRN